MVIIHKDGRGVTNSDNMTRLVVNGVYLIAYMVDGSNHSVGRYDTEEDAKLAFDRTVISMQKERK